MIRAECPSSNCGDNRVLHVVARTRPRTRTHAIIIAAWSEPSRVTDMQCNMKIQGL